MKILISYPPLKGPGSPMLTQNRQFQWYSEPSYIYPIVSAYAATMLAKDGFDVIWNDCITEKRTYDQFMEFIKKEKPDIIAFESKTPVIKQHWRIIDEIKGLRTSASVTSTPVTGAPVIVLTGDHVTALPEESMRNSKVDFVVTSGDYDELLLNIARHLRDKEPLKKGIWYKEGGEIKNTGKFELTQDLNKLPFIDRELTKAHLYGEKWKKRAPFFYVMAGRDCQWGKCTFCAWTSLYPEFRSRSVTSVLDEIGGLIEKYGAKEIFDDTGTFPAGAWLREFCGGMIKRGYNKKILFSANMRLDFIDYDMAVMMKKAGFRKLKIGLESANQKTLDIVKKNIKSEDVVQKCSAISKAGIDIHLTIMVGYPWETKLEACNTLKLADELMKKGYIEMLQSTIVVPYPGTPLYDEAKKNNWFRFDPEDYERFDMSEPVFKTPDMEPREVVELCRRIYKTFLSPQFIGKRIASVRSFKDAKYMMKGAKAVLGHIADFSVGKKKS